MSRKGRPQKPYRTSWGDDIQGLYRIPAKSGVQSNRWKILATGERFTEKDERRAVQLFRDWQNSQQADTIEVEAPVTSIREVPPGASLTNKGQGLIAVYDIEESILWKWIREQLIIRPAYVAKQTGIPELASLSNLPLPKPSIRLSVIVKAYEDHKPAKDISKKRAIVFFNRLIEETKAKTLDDLTIENLMTFKNSIENDKGIKSAQTKQWVFGQIKAVIGFGLKVGLDAQQITSCLERCKVLWTATKKAIPKPQPISKEDFARLLSAGNGNWRAWLLCGLNLCMHLGEVTDLKWADFDFEKKTYATIRGKEADKRIPRAAILWEETIQALKEITVKGEYVFMSNRGTKFNRNSRSNEFAKLRDKASLPKALTFESIRDGAYTAACEGTTDNRQARVFAGHKAEGWEDNYVLRNPQITKAACEAVYKAYSPFPQQGKE